MIFSLRTVHNANCGMKTRTNTSRHCKIFTAAIVIAATSFGM